MQVAQRLYEGVDIGGETVGLITYMRTDGVQIAPEAIAATRARDRARISASATCRTRRATTSQGEERPGSARGDPPDRSVAPPAGSVARVLEPRPGASSTS